MKVAQNWYYKPSEFSQMAQNICAGGGNLA